MEGGVLGVTDLKNYSKQGKLDMSQTLKLSRAVEHLLEERMKSDDESHNGPALATPDRRPRKIVAWSGHSSEKEKGQLGRIKKVIANAFDSITDAFEVVSNIEKDILQDEDDPGSGEAIASPDSSITAPSPEHEEQEGQSYAARRSSSVDSLGPQTIYPPPPPPLPRGNKRDSMTNMASIARSKALRSGSLLKPSGRRKSDTSNSNLGSNVNTNLKSSQDQDEGMAPPQSLDFQNSV